MSYKELTKAEDLPNDAILFKHSATCGTSAKAKVAMDELAKDHDVYMIVVQEQRELCKAVADYLGIKHESPQVIVRDMGRVGAVFNHWHIDRNSILSAVGAEHKH